MDCRPGTEGHAGPPRRVVDRLRAFWDFDDLDATESRLRDQLASERGEDGRAEVLTQLARVEGLRGEFAAADQLLVAAEQLASSDVARARIDLERGRVLRSGGDPDAAFPLFVAAYEHALAAGQDFIAADAAHMAAIVEPSWAERGIEFAESSEDARYWLGPLWNNLGWSLDRPSEAVEELQAALAESPGPHPKIDEELAAALAMLSPSRHEPPA